MERDVVLFEHRRDLERRLRDEPALALASGGQLGPSQEAIEVGATSLGSWWTRQSIMATVAPTTSPHRRKGLLAVTIIEARS